MDSARTISRAWTVHCFVIGLLAVTCIAVCVAHWPVHGAPTFGATNVMLASSASLVVYALATTVLLHVLRGRCGAVYAVHALGVVGVLALVTLA